MALTRKGSRRIVVDGTVYHWRVRHRPSYGQALGESFLTFAVESRQTSGQVLVVDTGRPHPGNWLGLGPAFPVTPRLVATAIGRALLEGWNPCVAGPPHFMALREA